MCSIAHLATYLNQAQKPSSAKPLLAHAGPQRRTCSTAPWGSLAIDFIGGSRFLLPTFCCFKETILQRLPIAGRGSCQEVFRQGTPCDCLCFSTSPFPHPRQSSHVLALPGSASSAVSISDPGMQHPERCHPPALASPDQ